MSAEHITNVDLEKKNSIYLQESKEASLYKTTVDINVLRSKLKEAKKKERNGNYIFLGIVCSAVAITGVIASF
jgi:hypothetical protein